MSLTVEHKNSRDYEKLIGDVTDRFLTILGIEIEAKAVDYAPVDTGRLKGSITYATTKDHDDVRSPAESDDHVSTPNEPYTLHVGSNVEYAARQEYGLGIEGGWQGFAYLRRAVQERTTKAVMQAAMSEAINAVDR